MDHGLRDPNIPGQQPDTAPLGRTDVLVVGAGPVGVLTAAILAQHGVDVRIIQAYRPDVVHSRATVLWPRVLELLHQVGATEPLVAAGHRLFGVDYLSGRRLAGLRIDALTDTPFPFALAMRQTDTEKILCSVLRTQGVEVQEDTTLIALENHPDHRIARLRTADGRAESVRASWVVGADGAHSTVRKLAGASFRGQQLRVAFAITDAVLEGNVSRDVMSYYYSPRGSLALAPLDRRVSRIAVSVPFDTDLTEPSRDFFQAIVGERIVEPCRVGEAEFSAVFRVHARTADRFRYGRTLLAGDAAHVMSPAAAQGMNTGLQDAAGLAWRLAMVVNGAVGEAVLDDYDRERHRAAREVVAGTTMQTQWGVATGWRIPLRTAVLTASARSGLFQRSLAPAVAQTGTTYGRQYGYLRRAVRPSGPRLEQGARLPALPVFGQRSGSGWSDAMGLAHWPVVASDRFTLVVFAGRSDHDRARVCDEVALVAQRFGAAWVKGTPGLQAPARPRDPRCVVVARPDGHIHEVVELDAAGAWRHRLERTFLAVHEKDRDENAA